MEKIIAKHTAAVSISVVSHTQIGLVENLLHDIAQHCQTSSLELILTLNLDEALPFSVDSFPFPINVIRNSVPQGFATNHNQAFRDAQGNFLCNESDIRLDENPFPALLDCLQDSSVGVVAPVVLARTAKWKIVPVASQHHSRYFARHSVDVKGVTM